MTTTHPSECPDRETVGAFVEGRLGSSDRKKLMRHLDQCSDCRADVAVLAEFVAQETPAALVAAPGERAKRFGWLASAAAAVLVTIAGVPGVWWYLNRSPISSLVRASKPLGYRPVQARLYGGFAWADYHEPVRSSAQESNPRQLKLAGEAGDVLERAEKDPTAKMQHAAAIASLLIEKPADAIELLTKVTAQQPDDASAWSDLAAALDDAMVRSGRPEPRALAAADRALKIDSKLPEALFNRALILEHMQLLVEARYAWERYLEVDSDSEWASEARRRRDGLPKKTDDSLFKDERSLFDERAAAGDGNAVAGFVKRFPKETRGVETDTLGKWGVQFRKGNKAEAARQLDIARITGTALSRIFGESLLADIVGSIDHANDAQRAQYAEAFATYTLDGGDARTAYLRAAKLLSGTPGELPMRFLAAVHRPGSMDISELTGVASDVDPHGSYKGLRAQIARAQGTAAARLVQWAEAIPHYTRARALFVELGDRSNAALMTEFIGEAYAYLGRRDEAWKAWSEAFPVLSRTGPERAIYLGINVSAQAEWIAGNNDAAMSLFDVALRHGKELRPDTHAEVLFRRAMLSARAGDTDGAAKLIAEGRIVATQIKNETDHTNAIVEFDVADGVAFAKSDPQRALASLTRAIDVREGSRRMLLPAALFERGRVHRSLGHSNEARTDFESAIEAVEEQRKPVQWRDTKSGALDGVDEIYIALAELLLERGETREAFAKADRAAAHAFYGADATASVTSLEALQQRLAPGMMVVEYLILSRKTIIFFVDNDRFAMRETPASSAEVAQELRDLDKALRERASIPQVQAASVRLHKILIAPVQDLLARGDSITFVPDPLIASLPFAALFDAASGRWLIEDKSVRIVPSALTASRYR